MASKESMDKPQKAQGRLRYESLLKAMPQDILKELAKRKLEEIAEIRKRQETAPW